MIPFTKMHGLGNDFVIIDSIRNNVSLNTDLIRNIADRHFGIGCDQVLVIENPLPGDQKIDFVYRVFNADGSEAGQCGNGIRCLAKFVDEQGLSNKRDLVFVTKSRKIYTHLEDDGQVTVSIGSPIFDPKIIPFMAEQEALRYNLIIPGYGEVEVGAISVGNPHAIVWMNDNAEAPVETLGPLISRSGYFPEGANVNFIQILDRSHIRLRVYERGSGETLACGSGACASVVVGRLWGLLESKVTVKLFGGDLFINWDELNHNILMTGPAETVFVGRLILGR